MIRVSQSTGAGQEQELTVKQAAPLVLSISPGNISALPRVHTSPSGGTCWDHCLLSACHFSTELNQQLWRKRNGSQLGAAASCNRSRQVPPAPLPHTPAHTHIHTLPVSFLQFFLRMLIQHSLPQILSKIQSSAPCQAQRKQGWMELITSSLTTPQVCVLYPPCQLQAPASLPVVHSPQIESA